jgi:hypothetical protein
LLDSALPWIFASIVAEDDGSISLSSSKLLLFAHPMPMKATSNGQGMGLLRIRKDFFYSRALKALISLLNV